MAASGRDAWRVPDPLHDVKADYPTPIDLGQADPPRQN